MMSRYVKRLNVRLIQLTTSARVNQLNMKKPAVKTTQSVDKVLNILAHFMEAGRSELSITEMSQNLKMPKSTVCRLVKTLQDKGYLAQNPHNGKYLLGLKLFELGSQVPHIKKLRDTSFFHMEQLRQATESTIHIAVLDNNEALYIVKVQAKATTELISTIGKRAPVYCTAVGKVLLAYLPPQALDHILKNITFKRYTPKTICSSTLLQKELSKVREQGYSVDNYEYQNLCLCVGAPIRQNDGQVVAALSISQVTTEINTEKINNFSRLAKMSAANISRELGYSDSLTQGVAFWT